MAVPTMTYDEARPLIKDGDIIHMWSAPISKWDSWRDFIFPLVNYFTGSPIYHQVIAMWVDQPDGTKKLMTVETTLYEGKSSQPLSFYAKRTMEVQPLPATASFEAMKPTLLANMGTEPYSYLDFLMIGIREFFGLPAKHEPGEVCSELCANAWIAAGVPIPNTLVSPGKLHGDLIAMGYPITIKIDPPDYNHPLD